MMEMPSGLDAPRVLIVGGTGRVGTAVASHLVERAAASVVLAGRDASRGKHAVAEVVSETNGDVVFEQMDFRDGLVGLSSYDAVVHVAGPFYDPNPCVLRHCISAGVPVYVDVSDPLDYVAKAAAMSTAAEMAGTTALICAGAFPGMSNVLAIEGATLLPERPRELNFSYFTAGLGGSGALNLEITNYGFGEQMGRIEEGNLVRRRELPGSQLGQVDFFGIGSKKVWAWPFPEAATVGEHLGVHTSIAGMTTAPDIWNDVIIALARLMPRSIWKTKFSLGLAKFSEPLVKFTDGQ